MRIFIDSSAIIAFERRADELHGAATRIFDEAKKANAQLVLSDHILDEVVTFLKRKDGPDKAYETGKRLLESREVTVLYAKENDIKSALERVRKYPQISLCDALSTVMMEEHGIVELCSFDSDFDRFKQIRRLR